MIKPETLSRIKAEAFEEGLNDTLTDDILCEAAQTYIDSEVTAELTDKQREEIINEYIKGFISGYNRD